MYSKTVIFQNCDDRNYLVDLGLLECGKTEIVHGSGVNISEFKKTPLPAERGILYIGRLIADKGVREYLSAARRIKSCRPDVRCMLVGPFDTNPSAISREELQPYIDEKIIEYFGEQKDVRPYLEQCTVYVLPSYHEGTPKTVLEAMAIGRAVVTTEAPGCRETVESGINGYLVPIKDVEALEKSIIAIIDNAMLAQSFGDAGRHIAEEKYDVDKVNGDIMRIMGFKSFF